MWKMISWSRTCSTLFYVNRAVCKNSEEELLCLKNWRSQYWNTMIKRGPERDHFWKSGDSISIKILCDILSGVSWSVIVTDPVRIKRSFWHFWRIDCRSKGENGLICWKVLFFSIQGICYNLCFLFLFF